MARLKSEFWVAAHLRRCGVEGIEAVQRRRGSAEAGAIYVSVDHLDGHVDLYGPAPQSVMTGEETDRIFAPLLRGASGLDVETRMAREVRFDPDLWWISIDDRLGRSALTLAPDEPTDGSRA